MSLDEMMMRIISRGSAFVGFLSCNGGDVERLRALRLSFFVSQRFLKGSPMESPVDHASTC